METILFIFIIIAIIYIFWNKDKFKIIWKTILKKGLPKIDDRFGCYFVTGRQGSGKSYFAVQLLLLQDKSKVNKVYTNVKSLNIKGYDIVYFNEITELYTNIDENCIFLIDEISRKYDRNSRTDTQFYAWLNQSRKRKRIVIMITQEWRELPMWIRRPAKFNLTTRPCPILSVFGFYLTTIGDSENMIFDKDESEYICPPIKYYIYRRTKQIAEMYDTFEAINTL